MTLFHAPSVQSPKAYDLKNLQAPQLAQRIFPRTAQEIAASVTPASYAYFGQPWLWVRREGCVLDGTTDDSTAFNKCLSVASTTNMALLIDAPCYLNSNITIPPNVQLVFVGNGKLKPGSAKTITLCQTPQAGLWQIFDYSAGGLIAFGGLGRTLEVWGEWWGANGDGVTNVANDVPINAALVSIWNGGNSFGGTVRLGAGLFFISAVILLQNYTSIRGLNDWTKIKAKSTGWAASSVMIDAINGTSPMFDSRLEYLTIDANNVANIQLVVRTYAWQQRCGLYFCELLNFTQTGFFYAHGYGGAAVMELVSTDFFPNDVTGAVGAYFTGDGTVGWTKVNVRNCTFASGGVNATIGLWIDARFVCAIEGLDVEELQYGIVLGNGAVLTGAGLSGGGQLPAIAGNSIVRCLGTWTGPTTGNVNVIGVQIGGWRNMLTDQNRAYACSALNPYDGQLVWPPNLSRPQGGCQVTGGAAPVLVDSYGVVAGGSIAHTATGEQTLTLVTSMDTSADIVCKVSSNDPAAPQIATNVTSATTIQIFTKSATGVATDAASFVIDVYHVT
jgi:hypothetical protein